jgi:hypothetical protein
VHFFFENSWGKTCKSEIHALFLIHQVSDKRQLRKQGEEKQTLSGMLTGPNR